jgi:hypothetical protein
MAAICDLDIYRAANLLIERHADDALIEAPGSLTGRWSAATATGSLCGCASSGRLRFCRLRRAGRCIKDKDQHSRRAKDR